MNREREREKGCRGSYRVFLGARSFSWSGFRRANRSAASFLSLTSVGFITYSSVVLVYSPGGAIPQVTLFLWGGGGVCLFVGNPLLVEFSGETERTTIRLAGFLKRTRPFGRNGPRLQSPRLPYSTCHAGSGFQAKGPLFWGCFVLRHSQVQILFRPTSEYPEQVIPGLETPAKGSNPPGKLELVPHVPLHILKPRNMTSIIRPYLPPISKTPHNYPQHVRWTGTLSKVQP